MRTYNKELEIIADDLVDQSADETNHDCKPNYSNRDFLNIANIFLVALMDKMYDNQNYDNMDIEDRIAMSVSCGNALRKLVHTYTGLDTHNAEDFV